MGGFGAACLSAVLLSGCAVYLPAAPTPGGGAIVEVDGGGERVRDEYECVTIYPWDVKSIEVKVH